MNKLICPECKGDSYSSDEIHFSDCPYCGVRFSGLYGLERMREERVQLEQGCSVYYNEQNFDAITIDVSQGGLSLEVVSDLPTEADDIIDLTIVDYPMKAKIMWINRQNNHLKVGLRQLI